MTEESIIYLLGYKESIRRYLVQGVVVCGALSVVLLFIFGEVAPIPFLIALGSLLGEMWWKSKKSLVLNDNVLQYGGEVLPWSDIVRYTAWGPFGIPWTPVKLQGVTLYLKDGTQFSIHSSTKGYSQVLQKLESQKYPSPPDPLWYQYPSRIVRLSRYAIAFTFSFFILLIVALKFLIILLGVAGGYFVLRSFAKSRHEKGQSLPLDAWIASGGSIILFCVLYYIFQEPYILFFLGTLPVGLIIWFPWRPSSLALISDSLFVGEKKAYPLRHLRTIRTISRFFVFKVLRLSFANGDVSILPLLENFEQFKERIENHWNDIQKRYQGRKMSEEEAEVKDPEEEARKIRFFQSDRILLGMPTAWQFWLPFFSLVHLALLVGFVWCVHCTVLGKIAFLGLFLHAILPLFVIVYAHYLCFSMLPRMFCLPKRYEITDEGIQSAQGQIAWGEIQSIVPHQDADGRKRIALFDKAGKMILAIWEEMTDWQLALQKIKSKVKKAQKYDPVGTGTVTLMNRKSEAWQRSRHLLVSIILCAVTALSIVSLLEKKNGLPEKAAIAVTGESRYLLPKLWGERFLEIPYQSCLGETFYAIAVQKETGPRPSCTQITLYYHPDDPLHSLPCNGVEDPLVALLVFLEAKGLRTAQVDFLESLVSNIPLVLWGMALVMALVAILHRGVLIALVSQKIPPPLGPQIDFSKAVRWQNTIRMGLHAGILSALLVVSLHLTFPSYLPLPFSLPVPVSGLWIAMGALLPILLCPYLAYCLATVFPEWMRSFKRWELQEEYLQQKKVRLSWEEIKSVAVFTLPPASPLRMFKKSGRKIALISGEKDQICLEGDLIHFESLVSHIRKKAKCPENDYGKARYFLRKQYSFPRLARVLTGVAMLALLSGGVFLIRQRQEMSIEQGSAAQGTVLYTFLKKISLLSYEDARGRTWYTFAWQDVSSSEPVVLRVSNHPAFWESVDWKVDSFRGILARKFSRLLAWLAPYDRWIGWGLWGIVGALLVWMLIPGFWFFVGTVWGIPPLNPEKMEGS